MSETNKRTSLLTGCIMTVLVTLLAVWGMHNHEPWFDEAQAWVIARDASWHDILFLIPHYEGHPPLWHAILKLVSYTGLPFEPAIKLIQLVCFEAALVLLEFRSPFKPILKVILPLNYFFLFQFAVISRPYALLMTALFLCAACYKNRYEKPVQYVLTLLLMCLCHSYGIALAGGIVIADILTDSIEKKSFPEAAKHILGNKKLLVMYVLLLICALCLIAEIMPESNAYAAANTSAHSLITAVIIAIFTIPAENLCTSNLDYALLRDQQLSAASLIITGLISVVIWAILLLACRRRKKTLLLVIPSLFLLVIFARYAYPYHYGVLYIHFIFVLWVCADAEQLSLSNLRIGKLSEDKMQLVRFAAPILLIAPVIANISWITHSYDADKKYDYYPAATLAHWVEENDYQNGYRWLAEWDSDDTNFYSGCAVVINSYLNENLFCNMYENKPYFTHIHSDSNEMAQYTAKLRQTAPPDFILSYASQVDRVCGELELDTADYELVFSKSANKVYKDTDTELIVEVYALKGLVKNKEIDYGL